MNSKRIGNIGEAYALAKLVELGIPVYQQFGDNEPADYLIIIDDRILKVQVKTSTTYKKDTTLFDLTSSTVHRKNGVKHKYGVNEVDLFICYDIHTKQLFAIKNTGNMGSIRIRYTPTDRVNQYGIHYSNDFLLCVETLHEIASLRG